MIIRISSDSANTVIVVATLVLLQPGKVWNRGQNDVSYWNFSGKRKRICFRADIKKKHNHEHLVKKHNHRHKGFVVNDAFYNCYWFKVQNIGRYVSGFWPSDTDFFVNWYWLTLVDMGPYHRYPNLEPWYWTIKFLKENSVFKYRWQLSNIIYVKGNLGN